MPGKISQEKIDQIRQATDIVELISRYLTLTKKGKNYFGLCPFHSEKTPSFSVNSEKQIFHCFGCGKGGNAYTFLMEHDKIGFIEAVRNLAEKTGIPLDYSSTESKQYQEKEALYFTAKFAARFFYQNLRSPITGQIGQTYFKTRQLTPEIIKKFGLGYALNLWDGLMKAATQQNIKIEQLEKCGLIIPRKESGGFYDRFRNRVIFPVFDSSGRVVAFGARRLVDDNSPKYINSPETLIYQKRETLYGLAQTRQAIQSENLAIMVEGYMDLISLFQTGIQNVVATSGTALTPEHAKLIGRYTKNVILLYDGDSAGSKAALRGLDILLEHDLEVQVAQLPQGNDPDSFVKSKGVDEMRALLKQARPLVAFKINMLAQFEDTSSIAGKTRVVHSILDSVIKIKDSVKQEIVIRDIAEQFSLDEMLLLRELAELKKKTTRNSNQISARIETEKQDQQPAKAQAKKSQADAAEVTLTKLLIRNPDLYKFIFHNLDLQKINHLKLREIIKVIFTLYEENKVLDHSMLMSHFTDPRISTFIVDTLTGPSTLKDDYILAEDSIMQLQLRDINQMIQNLQMQIRETEKQKQDAEILKRQLMDLINLREEIKQKKFIIDPKNT